jgi:hypothetical protein
MITSNGTMKPLSKLIQIACLCLHIFLFSYHSHGFAGDINRQLESPRSLVFENRSRAWIENYVCQPIPDGRRNSKYLGRINHYSENYNDIDASWFINTTDANTTVSRNKTNQVARLAFNYHTPETVYYKDSTALNKLKNVFQGIVAHVNQAGKFTWETNMNKWGYNTQQHEHAWRLEPLILAYIWI